MFVKKIFIIYLVITVSILVGCNSNLNSKESVNHTLSISLGGYKINDQVTPQIINESDKYKDIELKELNSKINSTMSEIYFLDEENIILSLKNNNSSDNPQENYDLYKYNLSKDVLTFLCSEYVFKGSSTINVKDCNNFSITTNGSYLAIENNKAKILRDLFNEARNKYPGVSAVYYNEDNNKILLGVLRPSQEAYLTDEGLESFQKLPFKNIYRVQWADKENVLVAYTEDSGGILAKYNIIDETYQVTNLPENNYFIDPVISDKGIIRFLYLNDPYHEMPWGFLDINKGIIDRIYFENCNPISIVRNNRMVGFSQTNPSNNLNSKLFLYNNETKTTIIRNDSVDYPCCVAVSPNGSKVIYGAGIREGKKYYINTKSVDNY